MTNNNFPKFYNNHKGGPSNQVEKNSCFYDQDVKDEQHFLPSYTGRHVDQPATLFYRFSSRTKWIQNSFPALTNRGGLGGSFVIILLSAVIIMLGLSYISVPLYQIWCSSWRSRVSGSNFSWNLSDLCSLPGSGNKPIEGVETKANVGFGAPKRSTEVGTNDVSAVLYDVQQGTSSEFKQGTSSEFNQINTANWRASEARSLQQAPITIHLCADVPGNLPWDLKPSVQKIKVYPGDTALTFYTAHNLSDEAITGVATYGVSPAKAGAHFNKIQCFCFEEQRLKGHEYVELPILFFIDPEFSKDPKMKDIDCVTLSYTFCRVS